jgi:DNA-binding NtrC family response regulator
MSKTTKLRILYGEGEPEAQAAPAAGFEKAGYTVQKALGRKAVVDALQKSTFDLVVLGPSLTRNDRHHLPYIVKKAQAEAAVLVMHADGSRHPYVDACTDTGASVDKVLTRIEGMKIAGVMSAGVMSAGAAAGRS